jgi:hypothetical protein
MKDEEGYQYFFEALKTKFSDSRQMERNQYKIEHIKMRRNYQEYKQKFMLLVQKTKALENQYKTWFSRGLHYSIRNNVMIQETEKLDSFVKRVTIYVEHSELYGRTLWESQTKDTNQQPKPTQQLNVCFCEFCKRNGHTKEYCRFKNNFNKHQNDKNKVNLVSAEDSLTQLDINNKEIKSDSNDYINDSQEQISFLEVSSLDEKKENRNTNDKTGEGHYRTDYSYLVRHNRSWFNDKSN